MTSLIDTKIVFFGGAANPAVIDAVSRLADAGYDVVAGDHDPREGVELREAGIPLASGRAEALEGAGLVLTSCRGPEAVEDLYLGDNGLLELMGAGSCAIDLSVSTPNLAREIQAMGAISDIDVIDAPVVNLGERERPCTFVGASPELQERYAEVFPYLAASVYPQNAAGEGQFAAMIAHIALAGSIMGAVEAVSVARVAGFPANSTLGVLAETAGASRALVEYVPRAMEHDYSGHLKVSEFLGALEVALAAAEELDITVPMVETAYQLYELLSVVGGDELNIQAIALLYEDEQTCAEHGLDWALADRLAHGDDEDDDEDGFEMGGFFPGGDGGGSPFGGFFSRN